MSETGCPWADILHNIDGPVWVRLVVIRLTFSAMVMCLYECGQISVG
jgi:hypothetical protein